MKNSNKLLVGCVLVVIVLNAYLASGTSQVKDQEQLTFKKLGQIETGGTTYRVEVIEDTAYVADFKLGFKTYDISDPGNPLELDTLDHPNYSDPDVKGGHSLVIRNSTAIVDFTHGGLRIINISDSTDLSVIGSYYSGGEYYGLAVNDNFVYTVKQNADERDDLLMIDISDISSPFEAGQYSNGHPISISYVHGNIAYVRDYGQNRLLCLDVTDPANIEEIGQIDWNPIHDVEIISNRAYVGTDEQGLRIYDMSDPLDPQLLGQYESGCVSDVDIVGDLVFVTLCNRGLKVFKASSTDLLEVGHYNDGGTAMNFCVQNDVAYIVKYTSGIEIVQIQGLDGDITTITKSGTVDAATPGFRLFLAFTAIASLLVFKSRKEWK
ncbi:MAG: LVIVD repeat-containing protein [Candidatus Hodarchaeales archaeon]